MAENADQGFYPSELPDRKKKGIFASRLVKLTAIFLVGIALGYILWFLAADVLAFGRADVTVDFTVSDSDTLKDISLRLKSDGLVRYAWLFRLYTKLTHADTKIRSGSYILHGRYDYHAIVKTLSARKVSRA